MKKTLFAVIVLALASISMPSHAYNSKTEHGEFTVAPGERAEFPTNFVRVQTLLQGNLKFNGFQPFAIGRGKAGLYASSWFEIDETEVRVIGLVLKSKVLEEDANLGNSKEAKVLRERVPEVKDRFEHGLDLKKAKSISVSIDTRDLDGELTISCGKKVFTKTLKHWWGGGAPFILNMGDKPFDAELVFERKYADRDIWFMGDSYFNSTNSARWPYHMREAGFTQWMGDHLPGGNAKGLLPCFKHDLDFGTPKIVVWALLSNDAPDENFVDPNPNWLEPTQEFLSICKEKGITPIFVLSCSPSKNRQARNKWIKDHGYRYVDFPSYIVDHITPEGKHVWKDPAWLGKDKGHPTKEGAMVMWEAVKAAIPELK